MTKLACLFLSLGLLASFISCQSTTSLASTAPSLTVVAGTYSLPMTLTSSAGAFTSNVWITSATNGFSFAPTLVTTPGSTSASSYFGASGDLFPGTYPATFSSNDTGFSAPGNLDIIVDDTPIQVSAPAAVSINYVEGTPTASAAVTIDFSAFAPWQDVTVTPTLPAGESRIIVSPVSITLTPAVSKVSFVYQTTATATGNFSVSVSFALSGTNAASYRLSGSQTVNAVATPAPTPSTGGTGEANTTTTPTNGGTTPTNGETTPSNGGATNGGVSVIPSSAGSLAVTATLALALTMLIFAP